MKEIYDTNNNKTGTDRFQDCCKNLGLMIFVFNKLKLKSFKAIFTVLNYGSLRFFKLCEKKVQA